MLVFEIILCFRADKCGGMSFFEDWEWDFGAKLMIFGYFLLTLQFQNILFWDRIADENGLITTNTTNYALYNSYIRTLCGGQLHLLLFKGQEWCFYGFWASVMHYRGATQAVWFQSITVSYIVCYGHSAWVSVAGFFRVASPPTPPPQGGELIEYIFS